MTTETLEALVVVPTVAGTPFEGGFYVGRFFVGADEYALITAGKAGELSGEYGDYGQDIPVARSYNDGRSNTLAMAGAGSELAKNILALEISERTDWYLPSRDELELLYRHLKPTTEENYVYRHGENPSSSPVGYPYTEQCPAQTVAEDFKEGGAEAFEDAWYWSSTQYSPLNAWGQYFDGGDQSSNRKYGEGRARAVRRFKITN